MPRKKKASPKVQKVESTPEVVSKPAVNSSKSRFKLSTLGILILIAVFFVLGSVLYQNKSWIIAGSVNNRPVTSFELYKRMLQQYGKQTLDQIVVERLIKQEAANRNINISESEVDGEVAKIEESLGEGASLTEALAQQGMTLSGLKENIRLRLTAAKLVEGKVNVTDEEVDKYLAENAASLPEGQDLNTQKESVRNFLKEQKLNEEIQKLIQELRDKAKISTFV